MVWDLCFEPLLFTGGLITLSPFPPLPPVVMDDFPPRRPKEEEENGGPVEMWAAVICCCFEEFTRAKEETFDEYIADQGCYAIRNCYCCYECQVKDYELRVGKENIVPCAATSVPPIEEEYEGCCEFYIHHSRYKHVTSRVHITSADRLEESWRYGMDPWHDEECDSVCKKAIQATPSEYWYYNLSLALLVYDCHRRRTLSEEHWVRRCPSPE